MDGPQPPDPIPPRSPWARPLDGDAPTVEFELRPASTQEAHRAPRGRRWVIGAASGAVLAGGVIGTLALRSPGVDPAAGDRAVEVAPITTPAVTTTPTATTTPPEPTTAATTTPLPPSTAYVTAPPVTVATTEPESTLPPPPTTVGPIDVEPGTFSYTAAIDPAVARREGRATITVDVGSGMGTTELTSETDSTGRTRVVTDGPFGTFEEILDVAAGVGYYKDGGVLHEVRETDAEWVAYDLAAYLDLTGQSLDGLRANMGLASPAPAVPPDIEPTPLGLTELDGERVMKYYVAIDGHQFAELVADNPQFGDDLAAELYVTEDNRLRRLFYVFTADGESIATTMDLLPVEPGFEVALPDPANVELIDVSKLP